MKNKIELFEMQTLLYFIMKAGFISVVINSLTDIAKVDSYICVILGSIIGFFILLIYIKILNVNPNKNIYENIMALLGKKIGYLFNTIIIIILISFSTILYYNIINFMGSKYLYYTPNAIISLAFIIPIIYLIKYDIKVIVRCSIIIFFITIVLYFLSILGLLNQMKFHNLLPFMANGSSSIIKGTIVYICYVVFPIFTLLVIPKRDINNSSNYSRKLIKGYIFISILLVISEVSLISVLGSNLASLYKYPAYHLLRRIGLGGFIQRVESILAIQWILSIFLAICFICYNIKIIIKVLFNSSYPKYNFIIPLLIMLLSFIEFNKIDYIKNQIFYLSIIFIFLFIVPSLTIILKKEKSG